MWARLPAHIPIRVRWPPPMGMLKPPLARAETGGLCWTSPTDSLYQKLPPESSQYSMPWPTKLDKIKNLHAGVHSSAVGL